MKTFNKVKVAHGGRLFTALLVENKNLLPSAERCYILTFTVCPDFNSNLLPATGIEINFYNNC